MTCKAVILAGGEGARLGVLTHKRAKPAVPFAGKYRIIDFALSNCVNSGLFDVLILTQYRPHSLNEHIGKGRPWDLDRSFSGGVQLLQPYIGREDSDWYAGTADAVYQNLNFVVRNDPDHVLVMAGDHIYQMNYRLVLDFHERKGADVTICTINVPRAQASRFGILAVDEDRRVLSFHEKPSEPPGTLASMGIYIFNRAVLETRLREDTFDAGSSHDFGRDIVPRMIADRMKVYAYPYAGYWVDVGTLDAYWEAHMDLLVHPPRLSLNDRSWIIRTRSEELPPVSIESEATIRDSLLSEGTILARGARVESSVLSPGVYVGPEAVVRESVVLSGSFIEAGALVERAIVDKNCVIGHRAVVGKAEGGPGGIVTIGKNTNLPASLRVGRGACIGADLEPEHFPDREIPENAYIHSAVKP